MDEDAVAALAAELSGREAGMLAQALSSGRTLTQALGAVDAGRRRVLRPLMEAAGVGSRMREISVLVLRAIEAARGRERETTPVWTMPERARGAGLSGSVTAALGRLVEGAYHSVTISTYNLAPSSGLWAAMTKVSSRPEVSVRLYMDADVADQGLRSPMCSQPSKPHGASSGPSSYARPSMTRASVCATTPSSSSSTTRSSL